MRNYTFILLAVFLFFSACKKEGSSTTGPTTVQLTSKKWKLDSFQVWNENSNEFTAPEKYDKNLIIEFKTNGILSIQVNDQTGSMNYVQDGNNITVTYEENGEQNQLVSSIEKITNTELEIQGKFIVIPSMICKYYYKAQ